MPEEASLIAPCGMNCGICLAYLRQKHQCPGCLGADAGKTASCVKCSIKNCGVIKQNQGGFCYQCPKYPCRRLRDLDKRYRTKYKMSMIENLESIKTNGLGAFVLDEAKRWRCTGCGGVICVHRGFCLVCGAAAK